MNTTKLLSAFALIALLFTSCSIDDEPDFVDTSQGITINELLNSYELWYVDINQTSGYNEVPFLQIGFTISFRNGILYANNNLVGIGTQGNGFGVDIGDYNAYNTILDVNHVIDGFVSFDVYQIDANTIELYSVSDDTSYFLNGYNRNTFDYDFVFYDNIQYFLQEYEAWEKTYTSQYGVLNEFDNENYLQFISGGNDNVFRSSQDINGIDPNNLFWDYTGIYNVADVPNDFYNKYLTLDYDFFSNEFFELNIINDQRIELFHSASGTLYEFTGRGYIAYYRLGDYQDKTRSSSHKKRLQRTEKKDNPREPNNRN
jgi:hypothetical protein